MKIIATLILVIIVSTFFITDVRAVEEFSWWPIQSIDTMKYSRDKAGEHLQDLSFDRVIDKQVSDIAQTGATHVAIATPYDEEFIPFLNRWVKAARRYNLKVWFRGNFSGWEGWFGYDRIDRLTHKQLLVEFLARNQKLFENGDAFSSCPECENGGPGDPRMAGDATGHREFLIEEYVIARDAFHKMGLNVYANLHSMNGDVARLIMDEETTKKVGGFVVIDHYIESPQQLAQDIQDFATRSKGKIILGEFGAPIPDIHGDLSESEQAEWITSALDKVATMSEVIGINYWVNVGGSTKLWNEDGSPREATQAITTYFTPTILTGIVKSGRGNALAGVTVLSSSHEVQTDSQGTFSIPILKNHRMISASRKGFISTNVIAPLEPAEVLIVLEPSEQRLLVRIWEYLQQLFW